MTRFSLVLATIGRTSELRRFLAHLDTQTHREFELIVVDQNKDDRLEPFLAPYREKFPILRVTSEPGLSRARNVGLKYITGDVVAFPDDDCWYPTWLLERVATLLRDHRELDGVTGRVVFCTKGDDKRCAAHQGTWMARFDKGQGLLSKANTHRRAISISIFLRRRVVQKIGRFDETLSVGSGTPWGSGEDTDYPLRVVEAGFKVFYKPEVFVFHPPLPERNHPSMAYRAYYYGAGIGRVWRKHHYPPWFVAYYLLRALGGICLSLARGRRGEARYYLNSLQGRLRGWLSR
jgi:glycosyltransferase involved in cell wall biosynthesis